MAREPATADDQREPPREGVGRRTFLKVTGSALVLGGSLAGCTATTPDATAIEFGYGGAPMKRRQVALPAALVGSVATVSSTIEESESNDTKAKADSVPLGSLVTGRLESADTDWYAVDLTAAGSLDLTVARKTNRGKARFGLYAPNGTRLDTARVTNDKPASLTLDPVPTTGTYFVRLASDKRAGGTTSRCRAANRRRRQQPLLPN